MASFATLSDSLSAFSLSLASFATLCASALALLAFSSSFLSLVSSSNNFAACSNNFFSLFAIFACLLLFDVVFAFLYDSTFIFLNLLLILFFISFIFFIFSSLNNSLLLFILRLILSFEIYSKLEKDSLILVTIFINCDLPDLIFSTELLIFIFSRAFFKNGFPLSKSFFIFNKVFNIFSISTLSFIFTKSIQFLSDLIASLYKFINSVYIDFFSFNVLILNFFILSCKSFLKLLILTFNSSISLNKFLI